MLVKIRNKYAQEAIISVEKFSFTFGINKELQLFFTVLPDFNTKQLMTIIGLKESNWSKAVCNMNPDEISHFSSGM